MELDPWAWSWSGLAGVGEVELLRRYLTGMLTEEETEAVELRLLADDTFFGLAEGVERDVLADYARGALTPEGTAGVERRFSASPHGRARLALAKDLAALASPPTTTRGSRVAKR